uniref:NADH-ubiquinone oxidoreductase chain 2 n=1 Tax=Labidostomis taxicornis TaxID=1425575 RepID=A0A3G1GRU1_9CUCU|nr:NADH dehydrogenase subunit 2 [Labidostomis taxicornis]
MVFFCTMVAGSLIAISSHSWMGMWVGLEINLLSIIPLLSSSNNPSSAEAAIKYFITQAMASNILLMSIILMIFMDEQSPPSLSSLWMITQSALMIKMGAAPFHAWFPEVMSGLSWLNCLIMITWQKIAPMVILMNILKQTFFIIIVIVISALVGTILGINQISLRKIMAYSSINHISWMISAMMSMKSLWLIYFSVYTIISTSIILILNWLKVSSLHQMAETLSKTKVTSLFYSLNFFSLGGLPPFLGFLPKWLTIQYLLNSQNIMLAVFLTVVTLVAMFYYLRISFPSILLGSTSTPQKNRKTSFLLMTSNLWSLAGLMFCCSLMNSF